MASEQECLKLEEAARMIVEVVVSSQIRNEDVAERVKQFKVVNGGYKPVNVKGEVLQAISKLKLSRELSKESSETLNELLGYMDASDEVAEIKRSKFTMIKTDERLDK